MSKQHHYDKLALLGVEVDVLTLAEAIDYLVDHARRPEAPACYAIKPYVEFLTRAADDPRLQAVLNGAELSVADGVALLWAAAYLYAGPRTARRFCITLSQIILQPDALRWPLPDRAAGTNFTWPLLQRAAREHLRVVLIGTPKVQSITATADHLTRHLPGLNIVGTAEGYLDAAQEARLAEQLRQLRPDLILVGIGFPRQELLMSRLVSQVSHGVFIGEGGTFDYEQFGGRRPKAPAGLQRIGLEWLWRLLHEPRRLRRQLAIPRFIAKIWRARRN